MNLKKTTASLLTLAIATALPVTALAQSSNQTKVVQCNRIITITNAAARNAKSATNGGQPSSPQTLLKVASIMDSSAHQLENLSIRDRRLQGYRSQFVKMYRQTSRATRNFVTAYNQHNRTAADSALQALQVAAKPEKQLVANINTYCTTRASR